MKLIRRKWRLHYLGLPGVGPRAGNSFPFLLVHGVKAGEGRRGRLMWHITRREGVGSTWVTKGAVEFMLVRPALVVTLRDASPPMAKKREINSAVRPPETQNWFLMTSSRPEPSL